MFENMPGAEARCASQGPVAGLVPLLEGPVGVLGLISLAPTFGGGERATPTRAGDPFPDCTACDERITRLSLPCRLFRRASQASISESRFALSIGVDSVVGSRVFSPIRTRISSSSSFSICLGTPAKICDMSSVLSERRPYFSSPMPMTATSSSPLDWFETMPSMEGGARPTRLSRAERRSFLRPGVGALNEVPSEAMERAPGACCR
mmetsp:Transcript_16236/g.49419  ORF Transcript_16236/g.49419 Transcript_16236/m.49419 type:complete len:207 (-) Transcript_16236:1465-2085(-)